MKTSKKVTPAEVEIVQKIDIVKNLESAALNLDLCHESSLSWRDISLGRVKQVKMLLVKIELLAKYLRAEHLCDETTAE